MTFIVAPSGYAIISPAALSTARKRATRSWAVPVDTLMEDFLLANTASASIITPAISSDVSSFILATTANTGTPASTTFEPIVPDTTALLGFVSIVVLCAVAAWVWANQVVPVARTNLARSKKNGPVREYLDELRRASGDHDEYYNNNNSNNNDDDAAVIISNSTTVATAAATDAITTPVNGRTESDRSFERWLFTDWLEKTPSSLSKPSALPVLKNAKWNSGDNPVLAATGLILLGVLCTAVTERIATTISL